MCQVSILVVCTQARQDSEARIDLLRQRAGLVQGKSRRKQDESEDTEPPQAGPSILTTATGHINLFEDLEQVSFPHLSI